VLTNAIMTISKTSIATLAAACFLVMPTIASAIEKKSDEIPTEEIAKFLDESKDINIQALPMGQFLVSQRGDKVLFTSENGRYKFQGPIIDTWAKVEINNYEDAKFSAEHMPLHNINMKPELLQPLLYGDNPKQNVLVFLSPDDTQSRHFLSELPSLKKDFQFQIVVVPNPNTPYRVATALSCVRDNDVALEALVSGVGLEKLTPTQGCDMQMLANRLIAYRLLGLNELPAVIAPSYRLSIGDRADGWTTFLTENLQ